MIFDGPFTLSYDQRKTAPAVEGIYAWVLDGLVCYVGRADSLLGRLKNHQWLADRKWFASRTPNVVFWTGAPTREIERALHASFHIPNSADSIQPIVGVCGALLSVADAVSHAERCRACQNPSRLSHYRGCPHNLLTNTDLKRIAEILNGARRCPADDLIARPEADDIEAMTAAAFRRLMLERGLTVEKMAVIVEGFQPCSRPKTWKVEMLEF